MKSHTLFLLALCMVVVPIGARAACSRANLTKCLDSVCALNIGANPGARCQYCGTADAGTPSAVGMRALSVGASSKYTISEKELKKAPSDPGARYVWATRQCTERVAGCTPDDVSDIYDTLIEQSCQAAGIAVQMSQLQAATKNKPTKSSCTNTIRACIIDEKSCNADWSGCAADADFDRFFAQCSVTAGDCDEHLSGIRDELSNARATYAANAAATLDGIVAAYQGDRESRLSRVRESCKNNATRDNCIESVCANNMPNKCIDLATKKQTEQTERSAAIKKQPEQTERSAAMELCKFYEIACALVD